MPCSDVLPLFESAVPFESALPNVGMGVLKTQASELAHSLIVWWELSGRRDPTQKPWMFTADQVWPSSSQLLDLYGVHVAEVMRCSAA